MDSPPPLSPPTPAAAQATSAHQENKDRDHVKLLAIFHFVYAGLKIFGAIFMIFYVFFFSSIFGNDHFWNMVDSCEENQSSPPPTRLHVEVPSSPPAADAAPSGKPHNPTASPSRRTSRNNISRKEEKIFLQGFFRFFGVIYAITAGFSLLGGILNFLSGMFLLKNKHRIFSLVVAGFNCIHIVLGTVLGIFTIMVLTRDSMRELYGED
jgi:hypothetical protein